MRLGSLFSGGGLGDLGWLMAGMDIRWQCEIDDYCQKILEIRFPETKKYKDIKGLVNEELEPVDIVAGGFPCQPFSVAGKQRGDQDDRNLWPSMLEVIKKVKPAYIVGENVPGLLNMAKFDVQPIMENGMPFIKAVGEIYERTGRGYSDAILEEIEACGYEVITLVFPAHALGAQHKRERVWIVGYFGHKRQALYEKQATRVKQPSQSADANPANTRTKGMCEWKEQADEDVADTGQQYGQRHTERMEADQAKRTAGKLSIKSGSERQFKTLADTDKMRSQRCRANKHQEGRKRQDKRQAGLCDLFRDWWSAEPTVGRVVNGLTNRVDRLKVLGNGQVVACTALIGSIIMDFERINNEMDRD